MNGAIDMLGSPVPSGRPTGLSAIGAWHRIAAVDILATVYELRLFKIEHSQKLDHSFHLARMPAAPLRTDPGYTLLQMGPRVWRWRAPATERAVDGCQRRANECNADASVFGLSMTLTDGRLSGDGTLAGGNNE